MPQVSVVMPVYNGEAFLAGSISSILGQTFTDFELIIVDDASTDRSAAMIARFADDRIVYHRLAANQGSAGATNAGHALARGPYIAHMDQDDLCEPDRLQRQVEYFGRHRAIAVVGGMMTLFGAATGRTTAPLDDAAIKATLLSGVGNLYNPTAMFRRAFAVKHGFSFRSELKGAADWGFWTDFMLGGGRFANLDASLVRYRVHRNQQSAGGVGPGAELQRARARILRRFYPQLSPAECEALAPVVQWIAPPPLDPAMLRQGLIALDKALAWKKASAAGEDKAVLERYLLACRKCAVQALGQA